METNSFHEHTSIKHFQFTLAKNNDNGKISKGLVPGILQVAAVLSEQLLCKCSYCYPTVCENNVINYQETTKKFIKEERFEWTLPMTEETKQNKQAVIAIYLAKSCFLQATS